MMTQMKELEDENKPLKKRSIEAQMQADVIKEAMSETLWNIFASQDGSLDRWNQGSFYSCGLR